MSQTSISASGLLRITATSGTRRVDLVLPGAVPVAELVPELARSVGLLDAMTVYGGYRLVTPEGRVLADDSGLTLQGVEDGTVLAVAAGVDDKPPPVYDDIVEAMTEVVEHDLEPWNPGTGRRTALWAAGLLMALGAVALLLQSDPVLAGVAAAVVATALVAGAVVLSRVQTDQEAAVTVGWLACGYGAVAGYLLAPDGPLLGAPSAGAGGGALLAGLLCLLGIGAGRVLVLPPAVVGAVFVAGGIVVEATGAEPDVLYPVVLTLVVLLGSIFPWLALSATSTTVDQLYTPADITADPQEIDPDRVSADARLAHEILVAISATVGLLLVLCAPLAVSRGLWGTLLAVLACLVVVFRTRQYRTGSEVLVGLGSGVLGLASVAVTMLVVWEEWRPTTAVVLAVAGALLLVSTLLPSGPSVRRGRLGDVLETISLVSLLPLLVVTSGLFDVIAG